jgi:hypothetical protein
VRVIDGDTIVGQNGQHYRLLGINTPEKKTFLSNESASFTGQLLNKTVLIESVEKDKYGRNLGYIFNEGKLFNEKILKNGLAHVFIYKDDKYSDRLRKAEEEARNMEIGLWKKSPNFGCISIMEFKYIEDGERCTNKEKLVLQNSCDAMEIYLKDDATHDEFINIPNGIYSENFSCVWNDAGDTLFIWDKKGLLVFERY